MYTTQWSGKWKKMCFHSPPNTRSSIVARVMQVCRMASHIKIRALRLACCKIIDLFSITSLESQESHSRFFPPAQHFRTVLKCCRLASLASSLGWLVGNVALSIFVFCICLRCLAIAKNNNKYICLTGISHSKILLLH